jgi:large subunit ribosomal protein L24
MKIRKNDNVIVLSGKDKGKKGKVLRVFIDDNKAIVEGVNISKRHQRPRQQGKLGEIIDKPMPIHISNLSIVDPKSGKPARIGYKVTDGKKVRIARQSGQEIK